MDDLLRILVVLALVAANAFFVIGEYAVVTARRSVLAGRAESGSARARVALRLMDNPVRVISTVQVGITALGILTGAVGEPLVREVLGDWLPPWAGFVLAFAIVTFLSVVLGELVPKALTLDRAETLAVLVAPVVELMSLALRPLVVVLEASAGLLLRPLGIREVIAGDTIRSPEELRALVDEAEGAGVIPRAQEELLHNVFKFVDREARDVMVPALDVAWLPAALIVEQALAHVAETGRSRYPVGRGTLDNLVGVVHVRDLVTAQLSDPDSTVERLAHPPLIVPETKDLGALLRELREQRQQLAVVVDEYGGTAGIVTLEDVLEELVGEIEDEFDLTDDRLAWIASDAVLVNGSMTIDDFNETVGATLPQQGPRTLAGLAFEILGRRPDVGDTVNVDDVRLTVEAIDGLRITQIRVDLPAAARPTDTSRPAG